MSNMIESMESRTLFTVSVASVEADVTSLIAAGTQAKADLKAGVTVAAADTKAIKAAGTAAHPSSVQKASLTAFLKAEAADARQLNAQLTKILAAGTKGAHSLISALNNFKAHPNSTTAQAKAVGAVTELQTIFSPTVIATVEANVSGAAATLTADSTAVATSIPSTGTSVASFQTHLSNDQTTVSADATAITTSLAALQTDLAA